MTTKDNIPEARYPKDPSELDPTRFLICPDTGAIGQLDQIRQKDGNLQALLDLHGTYQWYNVNDLIPSENVTQKHIALALQELNIETHGLFLKTTLLKDIALSSNNLSLGAKTYCETNLATVAISLLNLATEISRKSEDIFIYKTPPPRAPHTDRSR